MKVVFERRKIMKRLFSYLLVVLIFLLSAQVVFAKRNNTDYLNIKNINSLSESDITKCKKFISSLSDMEVDLFLINYLKNNDFNTAEKDLKLVGIDLYLQKPDVLCKVDDKSNGTRTIDHIEAWECDVLAFSAKRIGDSYFRLYAQIGWSDNETDGYEGTYDVVGIQWDSEKANYYSYNVLDDYYGSLKDASHISDGTVLFNLYDTKVLPYFEDVLFAVYVTPIYTNQDVDFGLKYTHTYREVESTQHGSASVSFSSNDGGVVGGSIGYSVSYSTYETGWDLSDTNAFTY